MLLSSNYSNLNDFLIKHNAVKSKNTNKKDGEEINGSGSITHTRIGSKEFSIYGGSYSIPQEELSTFYELYYNHVFVQKKSEYLTEKQMEDGPLLIDLDFRYDYEIETRQHTNTHLIDLMSLYLDELKTHFVMKPNVPFDVFIFEKPDVNRLEDKTITKDGIHMIIGIQTDPIIQTMMRKKILDKIGSVCDLPLVNTWDSVLDEGISKGTTNWQLYGSKKPNNEAYQLKYYYVMEYDENDFEFMMEEQNIVEFNKNLEKNFYKLSAQNTKLPKFEIHPKIQTDYKKLCDLQSKKKVKTNVPNTTTNIHKNIDKNKKVKNEEDEEDEYDDEDEDDIEKGTSIHLNDIENAEILEKAVNQMLKRLKLNESDILETHQYTQILPAKYYEPGSHLLNRSVAFALKNTDERLFLSWVMLRSKASDFDYGSIPELYSTWKRYFHKKEDGITKRSIMYWAKQDAYEDYLKVKNNSINSFIEESLNSATDFDFALVLYQMFKDKYVCCSIQNRTWFIYKNHRWEPDKGMTLRMAISKDMFHLFHLKMEDIMAEMQNTEDEEKKEYLKKKGLQITTISAKLKKTNDKNNIMREAMELFYDKDFIKCMDTNKFLMCFNNGVVDFKNKIFRDGYPQDYITKTTGIRYEIFDEKDTKQQELSREIISLMEKLFPIHSLNQYMWDHLSSSLIGINRNQTFNIYRGSGSNGKSMLTSLMSLSFGEYKGVVPIGLVTEKRVNIGGTSSEIIQLKGIRYAVMQEPSKATKMNEGIMKELTGGDPLQGRALYNESETFDPQFNLVVCTNHLFDIQSNDDGTWRRIRICDFLSKFVDENEKHTDNTPYVFPKDKELEGKLPIYAPVFMSMLVKRVFETDGIVKDCDIVTQASNKYRQEQDVIAGFLDEMIIKTGVPKDKIKKQELVQHFKIWYQQEQQNGKLPKSQEIYDVMDKKFGTYKKTGGWQGVKIKYMEEGDEMEEI